MRCKRCGKEAIDKWTGRKSDICEDCLNSKSMGNLPASETNRSMQPSKGVVMSDTRKCPFCAEDIKCMAIVCRYCGRDVEPLYVPNEYANRQILKIIGMSNSGHDFNEIVSVLNGSNDFYLDENNEKRSWLENDVTFVLKQFGKEEIKRKIIDKESLLKKQENLAVIEGYRKQHNKLKLIFGAISLAIGFLILISISRSRIQSDYPVCHYLESSGIRTGSFKKIDSNLSQCISEYIDIGTSNIGGLPNNIAYYVTGKGGPPQTLKVVLNVNDPSQFATAKAIFINTVTDLLKSHFGDSSTGKFIEAVKSDENTLLHIGNQKVIYEKIYWPNGNGFELQATIVM